MVAELVVRPESVGRAAVCSVAHLAKTDRVMVDEECHRRVRWQREDSAHDLGIVDVLRPDDVVADDHAAHGARMYARQQGSTMAGASVDYRWTPIMAVRPPSTGSTAPVM